MNQSTIDIEVTREVFEIFFPKPLHILWDGSNYVLGYNVSRGGNLESTYGDDDYVKMWSAWRNAIEQAIICVTKKTSKDSETLQAILDSARHAGFSFQKYADGVRMVPVVTGTAQNSKLDNIVSTAIEKCGNALDRIGQMIGADETSGVAVVEKQPSDEELLDFARNSRLNWTLKTEYDIINILEFSRELLAKYK